MTKNHAAGTTSNLPLQVEVPGYRLRRQVGSDAIGILFDAEQTSLGRYVTVKVIKPQYHGHAGALKEFQAEMSRLAGLEHPNLIRILDTVREPTLALVTERTGIDTLRDLLADERPQAAEAFEWARGLARGLKYLLDQGMAHKNIRPRAVSLLDKTCRLVTFRDVIPVAEWQALRGKLVQDPRYVAPEQLGGNAAIGEKTATYQVGAILFHMLAGEPPHDEGDAKQTALAHFQKEFPSLKRHQPFLGKAAHDFIAACTRKSPDKRPDLDQLAEGLENLAEGRDPTKGPEDGPRFNAPRARRRRRRR